MLRKVLIVVGLIVAVQMPMAYAQSGMPYGFEFQEQTHKLEVQFVGGYVWTVSKDGSVSDGQGGYQTGSADLTSGEYWGIEVDVVIPKPGAQLALLYRRQETALEWKQGGNITQNVSDVAVEYWQIGMVGGVQNGKVMPFTMFTLGATHYIFDEPAISDDWNFSMIFGLGAKIYLNERIALRLQGTMPFTFTSGWAGVSCGGGGCGPSIGGSGIFQFDLTAGIAILI